MQITSGAAFNMRDHVPITALLALHVGLVLNGPSMLVQSFRVSVHVCLAQDTHDPLLVTLFVDG